MALVSASSLIELANEGKIEEAMKSLEQAKEMLVRRALRIARKKQEVAAVVNLKKILTKVAGTEITTIKTDDSIVLVCKIERGPQVDMEYFNAISDTAKAKRGRLIHATGNASWYGFTDKSTGTKFVTEAIKRIEKIPQCKGITITIDKDGVGRELARPKK